MLTYNTAEDFSSNLSWSCQSAIKRDIGQPQIDKTCTVREK